MKTANDIMKTKIITSEPEETIRDVISKMEKHGVKEIPVVEEGKFLGMVTYYDILDIFRATPEEKIFRLMVKPPKAKKDNEINDIMTLMVKSGMEAIPIVEDEKLIGLISDYDLLKELLNDEKIKNLKIKDVMNESIKQVKENEPVSEARRIMRFNRWERLPIVNEEGKCLGMISSIDILKNFYKFPKEKIGREDRKGESQNPLAMPVKSFMQKEFPKITPENSVSEALKEMLENEIKGIPVLNEDEQVLGIFERWYILDKLVERKFKDGVWLNFSGYNLKIETIDLIKEHLKPDIVRIKRICDDVERIDIHIKKIHGSKPNEGSFEVNLHLHKKAGKGEVITQKEPWQGYNLIYTLKDAFRKMEELLKNRYPKRTKQRNNTNKAQ